MTTEPDFVQKKLIKLDLMSLNKKEQLLFATIQSLREQVLLYRDDTKRMFKILKEAQKK